MARGLSWLATALVLAALTLPLIFTALLSQTTERSFLVDAQTTWLELTFGPRQGAWRLTDAVICKAQAEMDITSGDRCGVLHRSDPDFGEVILTWAAGNVIRVELRPDGVLRIDPQTATPTLGPDDYVLTMPNALQRSGALRFEAQVSLGQPLADGATTGYVWSGTWQAREAGAEGLLFRSSTEVVQQGALSSGTRVRIWRPRTATDPDPPQGGVPLQDGPEGHIQALSFGHIAHRAPDRAMAVSLVSEFADTTLSVRYDGVAEAVHYKPDWVDVTLNSPALIAIAAIFPLLASLGLILSDLLRRFVPEDAPKTPAKPRTPHWQTRKVLRELRRRR